MTDCETSQEKGSGHVGGRRGEGSDCTETSEESLHSSGKTSLSDRDVQIRRAFQAVPVGLGIASGAVLLEVNDQLCEMLGYRRVELLGRDLHELYSNPRDYERIESEVQQPFANLGTRTLHAHWRCKDGHVIDVLINAAPLDREDPTRGYTFSAVPVAKHNTPNHTLPEDEWRHRTLFETAHDAIFILRGTTIVDCNAKTLEIFGGTREQIVGRTPYALSPPTQPDGQCSEQAAKELIESGRAGSYPFFQWTHQRLDGTRFDAEVSLNQVELSDGLHVQAIVRDVTGRKRVEDALRRSEEKYRSLIARIPDVVWTCDEHGNTTFMSPNIERVCGYLPDEICGRPGQPWFDRIHPDDLARVRGAEAQLFRQGVPLDVEYRFRRKDGQWIWLQDRSTGTYTQGGVRYADGVFIDVTERQRLEQALERRIVALTRPLDDASGIEFEALFDLNEIQELQDLFAEATGVASIITYPDGTPITRPSHFCRLCEEIIRKTPEGLRNCYCSDSAIGSHDPDGPTVQPCLSGGLWDAGASITVGGKHIANWLIGQVRSRAKDERSIQDYAKRIGADVEEFMEALGEVPMMPEEQFRSVAQALFVIAKQLSTSAYQNIQQARFITKRREMEEALRCSEAELRTIFESSPYAIVFSDIEGGILACNRPFTRLYDTKEGPEAQIGRNLFQFFSHSERAKLLDKLKATDPNVALGETMECIMLREDGAELFVEITSTPVMGQDGRPRALLTIAHDITERKRAEQERLDYEAKLRSLASELALAEERERRRIAADLHDHACQSLAFSKMKLQSLLKTGDPDQAEALHSVCDTLNETIENVRELTFDLSSPTLYKIGIEAALEELLRDKLRNEHNIMYRFSNDTNPKPLAHDVLVLLFQCVRELLINVIKHAQAHEVILDIRRADDLIAIEVSDDGVGFDVNEVWLSPPERRSVGLFNIRERLDHIGGRLDMDSRPSQGSRFTLLAPLNTDVRVAKESDYGTEDTAG